MRGNWAILDSLTQSISQWGSKEACLENPAQWETWPQRRPDRMRQGAGCGKVPDAAGCRMQRGARCSEVPDAATTQASL